jgi:AcrR family transcriptional regulator/catechol 2,3-dioxygenase-like lactoylglutathione lyase family enzyme
MSTGRPRVTSRDVIAEAACELFLEQGFGATTVADITRRAGVSRSSFFNYFDSKADVLWGGFDARLDAARAALAENGDARAAIRGVVDGFAPDSLALAVAQADAMGLAADLEVERAVRQARLARAIADGQVAGGAPRLRAEVYGGAMSAALLAAVWEWAMSGPGHVQLPPLLDAALASIPTPGGVQQLRLVVAADRFEEALTFYRDELGLPEEGAFAADGGARVVILSAGRATIELADAAQVRFIDGIETDGDAPSEHLRVALEVDDAQAVTTRLAGAGATVEASARSTPWRSLNARLRGPADLQLTVFEELGTGESLSER